MPPFLNANSAGTVDGKDTCQGDSGNTIPESNALYS